MTENEPYELTRSEFIGLLHEKLYELHKVHLMKIAEIMGIEAQAQIHGTFKVLRD